MKLLSSLDSLLASDESIEIKQHTLIDLVINTYQPQQRTTLFQTVTDYRRNLLESLFPEHQNKSLSVLFELMDYRDLVQRYPSTLAPDMVLLERAASQFYMSWLDFWCECEIAAIKTKSPLNDRAISRIELPIKDCAYYGAIIEHIESDSLMVQTPCHPQAMPISDAIALSNLETFIKGERWFEMLPLLHLSQSGKHFILLKHPVDEAFPTLVSSALLQDWSTKATWLSYAPLFSNEHWQYSMPVRSYDELTRLKLFTPPDLSQCNSIVQFDHHFQLQISDTSALCEILRLTVGGNTTQKLFFLYLAQKEMINLLYQANYKIGFTIIDQPLILDFYKAIGPKAYFHLGVCDLNGNGTKTYRGLWNIKLMLRAFEQVNFRDYRRMLRENKNTTW
ncbi:acyl-homoserine-lactone synthase [Vibrio chagasii]|uniref:acyl-homoserine-lactone synthase n=1 Tax=Vibrio chagasii TaxID=170679 RepID=UPI00228507FD|nr:acyl-homoserine-lactone synthase [Vibrio chagasii]MCY9825661.1 acyl-homoserine-lactone synthase [Vibrio chagasii]